MNANAIGSFLYFMMAILHTVAALAFSIEGNDLAAVMQAAGGLFWMLLAIWRSARD